MSGHSKWASIKHKKGATDAKKGKMFSKVVREIVVASRQGGGNPDSNPRLRKAMEEAKEYNMPSDNVKKAIQRGTGEIPGVAYEEITYEGYGPSGVAIILKVVTDNRNRIAGEVRKIFTHSGGNLGEGGCVSWMFAQKGIISISKKRINEEDLMSLALDGGAEDIETDDPEFFHVITLPNKFEEVKKAMEKIGIDKAEITYVPANYVKLEGAKAEQILRFVNELDELDDVQSVHANFDIPDDILNKI